MVSHQTVDWRRRCCKLLKVRQYVILLVLRANHDSVLRLICSCMWQQIIAYNHTHLQIITFMCMIGNAAALTSAADKLIVEFLVHYICAIRYSAASFPLKFMDGISHEHFFLIFWLVRDNDDAYGHPAWAWTRKMVLSGNTSNAVLLWESCHMAITIMSCISSSLKCLYC